MSRFRTIAVAAMIAVAMDIVCCVLYLFAGFSLGHWLYYPAYALLYPAFRVGLLIPERYWSLELAFMLPFIEFFFVALFALEVRRRLVAAHKENKEQDKQEGKHHS